MSSKPTKGNAPVAVTTEASGTQNHTSHERTENMHSIAQPHFTPAVATSATLTFQNHPLYLLEVDGEQWVRGLQIATALGFKNPAQDFKNLYTRNESEFTEHMTRVVDLPTAGGVQQVRVFTLRGAHLLGMLARTPVATAFRRWILDVLDGMVAPQETGRMTFPQRLGFLKFRTQLIKELGRCTNLGEALELFHNLRDVTRLLGMHLVSNLEQLAPGVRQQLLALEGGAA
jgi:hypothetical protein